MQRVTTRRYDPTTGLHPLVEEVWPTASFDPDTQRWRVVGPGWVLQLEGSVPEATARRICEAAADAIQFPTGPDPETTSPDGAR